MLEPSPSRRRIGQGGEQASTEDGAEPGSGTAQDRVPEDVDGAVEPEIAVVERADPMGVEGAGKAGD